jgi:hypothetical protein
MVNVGSYSNTIIPAFLSVIIIFAIAVEAIVIRYSGIAISMMIFCFVQFGMLFYFPQRCIPDPSYARDADKLVQQIKEVKGDVYAPFQGYLARRAGKKEYAHWMAIEDLLRTKSRKIKSEAYNLVLDPIRKKQYEMILFDYTYPGLKQDLDQNYNGEPILYSSPKEFIPTTGNNIRPKVKYWVKK